MNNEIVFLTLRALRSKDRPGLCSQEPKCPFLNENYRISTADDKYDCRLFGKLKAANYFRDGHRIERHKNCLAGGIEEVIEVAEDE